MTDWVVDASALLALLNRESGEERVADALADDAAMSAVNLSEVVAKLIDAGRREAEIRAAIEPLGILIIEFDADAAFAAGLLRRTTRQTGLSLGDRACLAVAQQLDAPALTADRTWADLDLGDLDIAVTTVR